MSNDNLNKEAYDLIRYLYKNMPTYNQLKGTYAGIQYILNLMGLCTTIIELWSPRTTETLMNFGTSDELYRADYLNAVRQRIDDWGNADIKDYYLTSKFDIDFQQQKDISFSMFNGMSSTVIDTIMQMKPVSRCLRRLYYILKINTDIHFEYMHGVEKDTPDITYFRYQWNITDNPLAYKTVLNKTAKTIDCIFLPWTAAVAKTIIVDEEINTIKNTYCNLDRLGYKLNVSNQPVFRFTLIGYAEHEPDNTVSLDYAVKINDEINIAVETNGIMLKFNGLSRYMLNDLFGDNIPSDLGLIVNIEFGMVLGSNYIFTKFKNLPPQQWTKTNVPAGVLTLHDFDDGSGPVPAIPVDNCGIRNDIMSVMSLPNDICGIRNDIIGAETIPTDTCGIRNDIVEVEQVTI